LEGGETIKKWPIIYNNGVAILAITNDKKAIMINEYMKDSKKNVLQLPGGASEENETPEKAAIRELEEETGWRGKNTRLLLKIDNSTRKINHHVYYFLITNLVKTKQKLDADELMKVKLVDIKDLIEMAKKDELEAKDDSEAILIFAKDSGTSLS
jgi:ADP-ribose pyrophosphatase